MGKRGREKTGLLFAPAERNVYRRAIGPRTALQRSAMWRLSESGYSGLKISRIQDGKTRKGENGMMGKGVL